MIKNSAEFGTALSVGVGRVGFLEFPLAGEMCWVY
jgi:hypothetical protein